MNLKKPWFIQYYWGVGIGSGRDGLNPYIVVPALVVGFAAVNLESSQKTNK